MAVGEQTVHRYDDAYIIGSMLDPVTDVLTLVESLVSREYLVDTLVSRHALTTAQAKKRSKTIAPHIETAIRYIHQSASGPVEVAFLPHYYALLNLSKVYILLGPRHADLPANRWHGATYKVDAKDSQNLLTEEITLKTGGALPLLYETLTGGALQQSQRLKMSDLYPFISDVGAEYKLATGKSHSLVPVMFHFLPQSNGSFQTVAQVSPQRIGETIPLQKLKLLVGFKTRPGEPNRFTGPTLPSKDSAHLRPYLRPFLLYHQSDYYRTPVCSRRLLLPEELPILLTSFHMSNVVRYKPEFFAKLRDSRYWPILATTQRHCLLKFLILFWSFVHQRALHIRHGTA